MILNKIFSVKYIEEQKEYWVRSALYDLETCLILGKEKRYLPCLFFGHLAIEKALKYRVICDTREIPPFTHDLIKLYKRTSKNLNIDFKFLDEMTVYNVSARYSEEKFTISKNIDKSIFNDKINEIKKTVHILCNKKQQ